jgi:hypothetical protein
MKPNVSNNKFKVWTVKPTVITEINCVLFFSDQIT